MRFHILSYCFTTWQCKPMIMFIALQYSYSICIVIIWCHSVLCQLFVLLILFLFSHILMPEGINLFEQGGGHCYSILWSMYIFCKYVQCYIYIFFIIPFISTLLHIYFRKPPRKKQKRNVAINVAMRFKISNKFISNV